MAAAKKKQAKLPAKSPAKSPASKVCAPSLRHVHSRPPLPRALLLVLGGGTWGGLDGGDRERASEREGEEREREKEIERLRARERVRESARVEHVCTEGEGHRKKR
jgi:hypothetical protein